MTPDEFIVFKETLQKKGAKPIVNKKLGCAQMLQLMRTLMLTISLRSKEMTMVYHPTKQTINEKTRKAKR